MATAEVAPDSQRAWWLRAVLVLQAPKPVFAALRDDSRDAAEARSEPITALVFLAGIAGVLLAPAFGTLFDDYEIDTLGLVTIAVFAGSVYGFFSYFVLGWALALGVRVTGGETTARRCRHVLAFSAAPLVLSLVAAWPLRLALYGGDVFRTGGSDAGTAGQVLKWLCVAFAGWSLALLVLGIRTVQRSSWIRALGASAFAIGLLALVLGSWAVLPGK